MKSNIVAQTPIKARGKAVSVPELAEILDLTPPRIRELITEGMPVFERGGKGISHILSTADCIYWYMERNKIIRRGNYPEIPKEKEPNDQKTRITDTKIAIAELQLAEKRGDLFHFSNWLPFIKDKLVIFRQTMAAVVDKVRDRFGNETARFVEREIAVAMNNLSRGLANLPNETKDNG